MSGGSLRQLALGVARALGLFRLCRRLTRQQLRILCYHGVWLGGEPPYRDNCLFMERERFARRMALVARLGYPVLPLKEAVARLAAGTLPDAALAITIDDAWFSTGAAMLPELKRHGLPATVYVTTYYVLARRPVLNVLVGYMVQRAPRLPALQHIVPAAEGVEDRARLAALLADHLDGLPDLDARWAELHRIAAAFAFDLDAADARRTFHLMAPEDIRAAHAEGFDIALHTHTHRMHGCDPLRVREELQRNREALAGVLGSAPDSLAHFCYPSGEYDERVFATLRQLGLRSATTIEFGLNGPGAEPLALKRILDSNNLSDLELEARLCGFWSFLSGARRRLAAGWVSPRARVARAS